MASKNNIKEAIVSYAIEKALIEYGNAAHEEVYYRLYREHALHFVDCYHNPEAFRKVLIETFGDSYCNIVELVRTQLGEYSTQDHVRKFLKALEEAWGTKKGSS